MPIEAWLGLAGGGGLLLALVAWLIYRAGAKDKQLAQEQDNAKARTQGDKDMDAVIKSSDAELDKRLRDL